MKTEVKVMKVSCDNPGCGEGKDNAPAYELEEKAGDWFKVVQVRSEMAGASLKHLDFCSPQCVFEFVNADVYVKRRDGTNLLGATDSIVVGFMSFFNAYKDRSTGGRS